MEILLDKIDAAKQWFDLFTVLGVAYLVFTFFGTAAFGNYGDLTGFYFGLTSSVFGLNIFGETFVFPKFVWYFGISLGGGIILRVVREVIRVSNEGFSFYKKQRMTDGEEYLEKHNVERV